LRVHGQRIRFERQGIQVDEGATEAQLLLRWCRSALDPCRESSRNATWSS